MAKGNESRIKDLRHSVRLFSKSPLAVLGLIIVLPFILIAILAPWHYPLAENYRTGVNTATSSGVPARIRYG